jgi:hypothetical protein
MTAYAQGDLYTFKAGGTNTGATTINVDSLGAKDVQFNGAACTGGEIVSGLMYTVVYDGTQFQLMNAASYPAIDITTLEVTNIKAKDGTASATIANSTGLMTLSKVQIDDGRAVFKLSSPGSNAALNVTGLNALGNANTPIGVNVGFEIASESTQGAVGFQSTADLQDAAFTLQYYTGYQASNLYCDSTTPIVTTQCGFKASDLTYATTNYGFYSDITASGTSRYNFYANGTAPNYFSGNVLIGSNSAAQTSIGQTPNFQLVGDAFLTASSMQASFNTAAAGPTNYYFKARGTQASPTIVSSGDSLGLFAFEGYDGSQARRGASIEAEVDGTPGASDMPGRIVFSTTADGSGSPTERMRITNDGIVDIRADNNGLGNLDQPLNILRFTDTDTTTTGGQPIGSIQFYNSDTNNPAVGGYIVCGANGGSGGGILKFGAAANAGTASEIARIAANGLTVTAAAAALGYGAGSGGAVTQTGSRTTGVTLDKANGAITLVSAAGTTTIQSFTVTNSTVAATDTIIVNQKSGTDLYRIYVTAVAAGSFRISFATLSGTTTEQPVFNFAVIKAVTS